MWRRLVVLGGITCLLAGCSAGGAKSAAPTTTTPVGNTQTIIRSGCDHVAQLERQVVEALDSSDPAARLKSVSTGRAWKAVSGIGLAGELVGVSGIYGQLVQDLAALNNGYAAAISGGPTMSLRDALSNVSADCRREGRSTHQ